MICKNPTSFTYLGLPVGANPRLDKTWQPLIKLLTSRLESWGNKYVNLGGRVVLLNCVLNAIPIFYMSVMKMPVRCGRRLFVFRESAFGVGSRGVGVYPRSLGRLFVILSMREDWV